MEIAIISVPTLSNKENITNGSLASALIVKAFKEATFSSSNPTNGEVIQALFPNASVYEHGSTYSINNEYNFNSTWWNAKYTAESEDKE